MSSNFNKPKIGYHTPIKNKSFQKSIETCHKKSNINAFQIFIRSPLRLQIVEINEKEAEKCLNYIKENNLFLVSHASYLFNFGTLEKYEDKINSALNDLYYAEKIGAIGSVFHVGKHLKLTEEEGIENMYKYISNIIQILQDTNSNSIFILETSAGCGTELLFDVNKLGLFFHKFSEIQKKNLKICIDTCHVFSSGYSLKNIEDAQKFIDIIEKSIGWSNVCLIHLNDSKKGCGCRVDRHENLCVGCITKDDPNGMKLFVNFCVNKNIPIVLETPYENDDVMFETYNKDLKIIYDWIE
jgi:deoxyribonuclease-4